MVNQLMDESLIFIFQVKDTPEITLYFSIVGYTIAGMIVAYTGYTLACISNSISFIFITMQIPLTYVFVKNYLGGKYYLRKDLVYCFPLLELVHLSGDLRLENLK